jgi:hypothetical protein
MCDCPEIQKKWNTKIGDWSFFKSLETIVIVDGSYFEHLRESLSATQWEHYIWLPRQDQIQEMMRKDHESNLDLLIHFYGFVTIDNPIGIMKLFDTPMEQLWLAFYMYEKHKKIWEVDKWLK